MLRVLKQAFKTGVLTNKFPVVRSIRPGEFRGKPVINFALCATGDTCANSCPSGALSFQVREENPGDGISHADLSLDYGKCVFCGECMLACPESITIAPELPQATADKGSLSSHARYSKDDQGRWVIVESLSNQTPAEQNTEHTAAYEALGNSVREAVHKIFGRSLHIREVDAGSCNGCEIEIVSLNNPIYDVERFGVHFVASPRHADMLLVTGPVTRNMTIALKQTYEATPDPKLVVAVGVCGISGGIFGQSYASCGGVDSVLPVDVYIPGCPPGPEELLRGILLAVQKWPRQL